MPGSYYDCVMPVSAESMWGPVPLPSAAAAVGQGENRCKAVTHGVLGGDSIAFFWNEKWTEKWT